MRGDLPVERSYRLVERVDLADERTKRHADAIRHPAGRRTGRRAINLR